MDKYYNNCDVSQTTANNGESHKKKLPIFLSVGKVIPHNPLVQSKVHGPGKHWKSIFNFIISHLGATLDMCMCLTYLCFFRSTTVILIKHST